MSRLHAPKYLVKRDGIYYFRMAIPTRLRERFGWKQVKCSLQTDDNLLARRRCRYLSNRFEELFMGAAAMAELSQDKLQDIARGYFRELLIQGNDRIFWLEDMFGNDPDDRADAIDSAAMQEERMREHHAQGVAGKMVASKVQAILDQSGITGVTPSSDSFSILCDYFVRAQMESSRVLAAKLRKDYQNIAPRDSLYAGIMDDTLPPLPDHGLGAPATSLLLEPLVEKFKESHKGAWGYKTRLDYERVLAWLVEIIGPKRPIRSVTTIDVGEVRDVLLKIPKNYTKGKGNSGLTLKQAIQAMPDVPVLSPRTAEKYLIIIRTFLIWCEDEGIIDKAPGRKISIEYIQDEKSRLPFTDGQMIALFSSPIWRGCYSESRRSREGTYIFQNAYYWIPLVAAFTGMRCGEIVQLRHMDISTMNGIPYIDINDDHQKKLKTKYSRRRIPLHPRLLEWGFTQFIAGRFAGKPEARIFDEIIITKNGDPSHAYSKTFARYLKDIGIKNNKLTFHSFRHSFSDALDNASVIEAQKKAMMGHSDNTASGQYGSGASVTVLLEAVSKIAYDFEEFFTPVSAAVPEGA